MHDTRTTSRVPELDDQLRRRLRRRFGTAVETWLDDLPPLLAAVGDRWRVQFESLIQSGTVSVVIRCRTESGRRAVLKVSPDRQRILEEAAALRRWDTPHVPAVLDLDEHAGVLLVEAVVPGTPLSESLPYPPLEEIAALMTSLHTEAPPARYESVAKRVDYLYDAGLANYERRPDLAGLVSPDLYERDGGWRCGWRKTGRRRRFCTATSRP